MKLAEAPTASRRKKRAPAIRPVLRTIGIVGVLLTVAFWTWRWLSTIGGPATLAETYGNWAPFVLVPAHIVLSATPFPSEVFGIAYGSIYGVWIGAVLGWIGWWTGGMIEFMVVRRAASDLEDNTPTRKLPKLLQRFPAGHPAVMIVGRQIPFGFHAVNIMAAVGGVSLRRQAILSAISNLIFALLAAAAGAGLVSIGLLGG